MNKKKYEFHWLRVNKTATDLLFVILWTWIILNSFFTTEWKRCLDRESNPGTLTYKIYALLLSYLNRQSVSIFSLRKLIRQTQLVYHKGSSTEWARMKLNRMKFLGSIPGLGIFFIQLWKRNFSIILLLSSKNQQ